MSKVRLYVASIFSCLFSLAGFWPYAASAEDPAALAGRVQGQYKKIQSISASYERISRLVAAGDQKRQLVKGQGQLFWARPVFLRLEQEKPRPELVVVQKDLVWWVRPSQNRAEIYAAEQFTAGLRPLMDTLGGLARLDESFDLTDPTPEESKLGDGGPVLVLIPQQKRMDLKRLVVWFEPEKLILKGFSMISLMGDVTQYFLADVKVNPELPLQTFSYTPPSDFKVIDHRVRR